MSGTVVLLLAALAAVAVVLRVDAQPPAAPQIVQQECRTCCYVPEFGCCFDSITNGDPSTVSLVANITEIDFVGTVTVTARPMRFEGQFPYWCGETVPTRAAQITIIGPEGEEWYPAMGQAYQWWMQQPICQYLYHGVRCCMNRCRGPCIGIPVLKYGPQGAYLDEITWQNLHEYIYGPFNCDTSGSPSPCVLATSGYEEPGPCHPADFYATIECDYGSGRRTLIEMILV